LDKSEFVVTGSELEIVALEVRCSVGAFCATQRAIDLFQFESDSAANVHPLARNTTFSRSIDTPENNHEQFRRLAGGSVFGATKSTASRAP
jgi:hypothetical protein